jgi:protein-L-isoaspartate(D-aspartate) O-methyltransferase
MVDYLPRIQMVTKLLGMGVLEDWRLLHAMIQVPRERFVPAGLARDPCALDAIALPDGTSITCPLFVARMLSLLDLKPGSRVLEIGTGVGYQTALLAMMDVEVTSIEIRPNLVATARENLAALKFDHVELRCADGAHGAPDRAPFDAVVIGCAADAVPSPLFDQLAIGGRLVAPVGHCDAIQTLTLFTRRATGIERRDIRPAFFVPLIRELPEA